MRILATLVALAMALPSARAAAEEEGYYFNCVAFYDPPTMRLHLAGADAILFGRCDNARKKPDRAEDAGRTDFTVYEVLGPDPLLRSRLAHPLLKTRAVFVLPHYLPNP